MKKTTVSIFTAILFVTALQGIANAAENKIYWTAWTNSGTGKIHRCNLNGNRVIEDLVSTFHKPNDIALDVSNRKMYWIAIGNDLVYSNLDGEDVEDLVFTGFGARSGIALDVSNRKMYWTAPEHWTNPGTGRIQRVNLDDKGVVEDLVTGLNHPNDIALDVSNRKMYWTERGTDFGTGKIRRANLDGKGVVEDLVTGLDFPNSIALDVSNRKIYWISGTGKIQRVNLDGKGIVEDLVTGLDFPNSIALDVSNRKMYWTETSKIRRANLDGKGVIEDLVTGLNRPGSIALGFGIPDSSHPDTSVLSPDLVVESPRVSKSTLAPGESFKLSAKVKNRGAAQANRTTLRYYRSSNSDISTGDTSVGTPDPVSALGANRSEDESITLNAPTAPGTYYYGACVESVANESDTGNNCSSAVKITVEPPVTERSDLVVEFPWVENVKNSTVVRGERFKFGVTVKNIGSGQAPPTTLRYYLSRDKTITRDDTEIDTDSVGRLARNGGKSDKSVTLTAPTTAGIYYYGVCVDNVPYESDTGNNCSTGFEITVSATDDHPNTRVGATPIEVIGAALRGPNRIEVGDDIDYFQLIVKGNGQLTVETTGSLDTRGTLENSSGSALASSDDEGDGNNFRIQHRVTSGTYYLKVISSGNSTGEYTVKANLSTVAPDLVVRSPRVSKSVLSPGESFTFSATVTNIGTGESAGTTLQYIRSSDDTIDYLPYGTISISVDWGDGNLTGQTEVDTDSLPKLGSGHTSEQSITLTAPDTSGTYYYGVCVDSVENESDPNNNCSAAVKVTVAGPDLVVASPQVSKTTLAPGESFTFSATVENKGKAGSPATTLRYVLSSDDPVERSGITTILGPIWVQDIIGDVVVNTSSVGDLGIPLGGRSTSTQSTTLKAPTTPGTYYYRACVASVENESDPNNNCSAAVKVTVVSTNGIVRVTPDSLTQGVGEPVTLRINIADAQDVIGYNFTLAFDPSALTYLSSRNGNYLAGVEGTHIAVPEPQLTTNSITLSAQNIQDYEASGTGTLAHVTFKVRRAVISTLRLSHAELTLKGGSTVVSPGLEHGQIIGSVSPPQQDIVRLIYFIPKDRSPQADIDEKLHDLIQGAQTFYAEQMAEKNGGVRKTFTFEADPDGTAVVHHVYGKLTNDEYYDKPWTTIKAEIKEVFDTSKNLFFIAAELASKRIGDKDAPVCGIGSVHYTSYDSERQEIEYARGTALIPATGSCFTNPGTAYHELGHAFGLLHDFRDGSYVMSYGTLFESLLEPLGLHKNELSHCAAEWLDASPFFNTNPPPATNATTTIKMLPPSADSLETLRFEISDADGLHQVQLIVAPTTWKPPPGFPDFTKWSNFDEINKRFLHACKRLDGVRDTFEFSRDPLSADEVMLQVIDKFGNITRQKFPLTSEDDHGDTLEEANPITSGRPNTGKITTGDDLDFYSIEASGPGIITAYTTGNLDTVGELQDSSGNVLKSGDDVGDNPNFRIRHRVTAGTYYIKVSSFRKITGSYTLHASFEPHDVEEDGSLFIYWSSGSLGKIQRMPADGTGTPEALFTKADGLIKPGSVRLDATGGKIYWIDWETDKIQRGNLDGSGAPEDLFTKADGLMNPMYLALDVANRKIYWTDSVANKIQRGNLNGFGAPENLLTSIEDVQVPVGIALDLTSRHIYWTENRHTGFTVLSRKIRRATLDGFNVRDVISVRLTQQVADVALDVEEGVIYWVDPLYAFIRRKPLFRQGDIEKLPFAGSGEQILAIELDTAAGKIYWLSQEDRGSNSAMLRRMNLDGTKLETLYTGETYYGYLKDLLVGGITLGPATTSRDISWADVNRDGVVDIQDLVYIAQRYQQTGTNNADVNGDNVVNVDDFVLVAAVIDNPAGAPAIRRQILEGFTAEEIRQWLMEARLSGNTSLAYRRGIAILEQLLTVLMAEEAVPEETSLLPNYPNPFNPETWIPYQLATPADVTLTIYDIHGCVVRVLDFGHQRAGLYQSRAHAAHWDGKNAQGEPVASGIYFYTLTAGDFSATRKMLIRK